MRTAPRATTRTALQAMTRTVIPPARLARDLRDPAPMQPQPTTPVLMAVTYRRIRTPTEVTRAALRPPDRPAVRLPTAMVAAITAPPAQPRATPATPLRPQRA